MSIFDPLHDSKLQRLRKHAAVSANANTGVIDMAGGTAAEIIMSFGTENASWNTTDKYTIVVKHGDTTVASAMETVTAADIIDTGITGVTSDWDNGVWMNLISNTARDAIKDKSHRIAYIGNKKYVAVFFVKGGSGGNIVGVDVVAIVHGIGQAAQDTDPANSPDMGGNNNSVAIVATA